MPKMTTKEKRKVALKEEVKHLLGELWEAEEEDFFYKLFTREHEKGKHKFLLYSKEELQELFCIEDDGTIHYLQRHETGDVRMLLHYKSHIVANELLPEDTYTFKFNSISRKDWTSFVNHPDDVALISST